MRAIASRILVLLAALSSCRSDPAELVSSLVEPATATAQYFHGNCFAGFATGVTLRVRETRGIEVVVSRLDYRVVDRGTGLVLAEEILDQGGLEDRFGGGSTVVPAGASKTFPLAAISPDRPTGPLGVIGELRGMDENGESIVSTFDLSARLEVNDPGPPGSGACSPP